jgi:hypothetical protein
MFDILGDSFKKEANESGPVAEEKQAAGHQVLCKTS